MDRRTLFSDLDSDKESRRSRCWVPVGGSIFGLPESFSSLLIRESLTSVSTILQLGLFSYNHLTSYLVSHPSSLGTSGVPGLLRFSNTAMPSSI